MQFQRASVAFFLSLAVHSSAAFWVVKNGLFQGADLQDPLMISYVESSVPLPKIPTTPVVSPKEHPFQAEKKEFYAKATQRIVKREPTSETKHESKGRAHVERSLPKASTTLTSAEVLSDPQKGKYFIDYFAFVKKKIQDTVRGNASSENYGHGTVQLLFVLNPDGSVQDVSVVEKGSDAAALVKDFAIRCVKTAGPFGIFPKEIPSQKIAFNLSLLFE